MRALALFLCVATGCAGIEESVRTERGPKLRDFDRPRYSDWRHVRHGYYFDDGYARIVGGYYHRHYYWWNYGGWHRPYRRWSIGYVIPYWLYWEPVPWDLYYMLPPAPYGCRYVYADGDILLVAIVSGIILDALLYDGGDYYYDDRYY